MKDLQIKYDKLKQQLNNNLIVRFEFDVEKSKLLVEAQKRILKALDTGYCTSEFRNLFPKLINSVWFKYGSFFILPEIRYEKNCVFLYFRMKDKYSLSKETDYGIFITQQNKVCFINAKNKKLTRRFIKMITSFEGMLITKRKISERITRRLITQHESQIKEIK